LNHGLGFFVLGFGVILGRGFGFWILHFGFERSDGAEEGSRPAQGGASARGGPV